jgi:DNA-binding HxlR family transcriptional regulator
MYARMSERGGINIAQCPSRIVLNHVTSRWGVLILMALQDEARRFNDLRRIIGGVSDKMLAQTLQVLEEDGIVERKVLPDSPPRVEYALSPMGREAALHLKTLTDWIDANVDRVASARARSANSQDK